MTIRFDFAEAAVTIKKISSTTASGVQLWRTDLTNDDFYRSWAVCVDREMIGSGLALRHAPGYYIARDRTREKMLCCAVFVNGHFPLWVCACGHAATAKAYRSAEASVLVVDNSVNKV